MASEALVQVNKFGFVLKIPSEPDATERPNEDAVFSEDDYASEDERPVFTSGLNFNGKEDQVLDAPPVFFESNSDDEFEDDEDLELLLPPKSVTSMMSMRILTKKESKQGDDDEVDPGEPKALSKSGYVKKLPSKTFAFAHMRWFFLAGESLGYQSKEDSLIPKKLISLTNAKCEGVRTREQKVRLVVTYENKRRLRMCFGLDQSLLEAWWVSIQNNISFANFNHAVRNNLDSRRRSMIGTDITDNNGVEMEAKSYYEILGVPREATGGQIKKTYFTLARNCHPDKNPDMNADEFAEIGRAYAVLMDPQLRTNYDLCETVKAAFRRGVLATLNTSNGAARLMAFFLDDKYENLLWQDHSRGAVLKLGYSRLETRFMAKIIAGEDMPKLPQPIQFPLRCLFIKITEHAKSLGGNNLLIEFDNEDARNDIMDGLRVFRCGNSMLFQQNLDKMKAEGKR